MQRDLARLSSERFELVVVGGGVLGAFVAWDAALRGLSVALLERKDWGAGTTSGSGKVLHGGLRALQHLDLPGCMRSLREQHTLRHLFPTLVRPLRYVVPPAEEREAESLLLRAAAAAWTAIPRAAGFQHDLPRPRYGRPELDDPLARRLFAGAPPRCLLYHDYQIRSPERLTLAAVRAADAAGAAVANHVPVTGVVAGGGHVRGVEAVDRLNGRSLEVRGKTVVLAAGASTPALWEASGLRGPPVTFGKGLHLVLARPGPRSAFAVPLRYGDGERLRRVFVSPWEGRTLVGASYGAYGAPAQAEDGCRAFRSEIDAFLAELEAACGDLGLHRERVLHGYAGLYPVFGRRAAPADAAEVSRRSLLLDHGSRDGPRGLFSAVAVKLTTARALGERVVDRVVRSLGRARGPHPLRRAPPPPGACRDPLFPEDGTAADGRLRERARLRVAVRTAVREEMACTLEDFVYRRSLLGHHGMEGGPPAGEIAEALAEELGWEAGRMALEVEELEKRVDEAGR